MKILLGWELGSGQAHIHRLAAIAQILEPLGFEPVFALKSHQIRGINFPWSSIAAPPLPFLGTLKSYTFADILEKFGFGNAKLLKNHLQAWGRIFTEVKPKLIIADYAPGLVLAAYGIIPTITIGGGFTVPPPVAEFPILEFPAPPKSFKNQQQVNDTVREVVKVDISVGQLLNGNASLIFSIPELDPYRYLRHLKQYVSLHITPIPSNLYNANGSSWAYLADDYLYKQTIINTFRPQTEFTILKEVLAGKSLAIHHGNLTTAVSCLLAGIPQLLFPRHLEENLNALALSQLGVAEIANKFTWQELLLSQTKAYNLAKEAQAQAQNLAFWNKSFLPVITQTCLDLIDS
ncbi:MAG: hypothetical protein QNJ68_02240 [Microcoleaceae cyanobacterium MO_207.B10]|nr:hypothetical protein [Microcoleaceae cyanobacterium MO_207.B10]